MPERPIERWLTSQHRWAQRNPWLGLFLIGVLCVASWFGVSRLSVGGVGQMFDGESPGAVRYQQWSQAFGNAGEVVVLIDTGASGEFSERAKAAAHALGESLRQESAVREVVWGLDINTVSPKMLLTLPTEDVAAQVESLTQVRPLLVSETPAQLLRAGMVEAAAANSGGDGASGPPDLAEGAAVFIGLMETLTRRMNTPAEEPVDLFAALGTTLGFDPWQFMRTASGRLLVVRAGLREGVGGEPGYGGSLAALRRNLDAVRARFEEVPMGLTGAEPSQHEAQAATRTAAQRAAGAGLAALWVLTALAWRDIRRPLVVTAGVGVGLWIALGWSGAVVGVITPLSLFAIASNVCLMLYGAVVWCGAGLRQPGVDPAAGVGPGVVIAALIWGGVGLGTALAPWAEAPGVHEAGWVSVGGALATLVVIVWVLPAVGAAVRMNMPDRPTDGSAPREDFAGTLGHWAQRSRRGAWALAGIILVVVGWGAWRADYSSSMLGYLPSDSEAAHWQRRAMQDGGELGLAAAVVTADLNEAAALTEQLRALPEVARVSGVARLVPEDMDSKRVMLIQLDQTLGDVAREAVGVDATDTSDSSATSTTAAPDDLLQEVANVRLGLSLLRNALPDDQRPLVDAMDAAAAEFLTTTGSLEPATLESRLGALQNDFNTCRRHVGRLLTELVEDRDLALTDVGGAADVFSPWIAGGGAAVETNPALTLKVYSTTADGWPTDAEMAAFFTAVRGVAPEVTGDLERFAAGVATLQRDLWVVPFFAVVCVALGLGAAGRSWRVGIAAAIALGASALTMAAAIGWLGQPVGLVGAAAWGLTAALVMAWLSQLAVTTRRPENAAKQDTGITEAFGLTLAVGFVIAAGLRGAQAPGITAVAIGVCIAAVGGGLVGLLLVQARQSVHWKPSTERN